MILSTVCQKKTNLHYCRDATKRRLNAVFFPLLHSVFVPKDCNAISAHIQKFHVELFFLFLELKDCGVVPDQKLNLLTIFPLFIRKKLGIIFLGIQHNLVVTCPYLILLQENVMHFFGQGILSLSEQFFGSRTVYWIFVEKRISNQKIRIFFFPHTIRNGMKRGQFGCSQKTMGEILI